MSHTLLLILLLLAASVVAVVACRLLPQRSNHPRTQIASVEVAFDGGNQSEVVSFC